jgi:hypothetical protein
VTRPMRRPRAPPASKIAERIAALAWSDLAAELDAHACAITGRVLAPEECDSLAAAYGSDDLFRSRIVMAQHGFGRGEYKYFGYPLPEVVAALRAALHPPLAIIANRWNEAMGVATRYPEDHVAFLRRCHRAGQTRPTPLLLQYESGDYNCLHQDLYGEHVFPLQVAFLLSDPGKDFTGGQFVLTEQRPRMQVARRGGSAGPGRRRDLPGSPSARARHARHLSGDRAPRRQPVALGAAAYARHHLPRC